MVISAYNKMVDFLISHLYSTCFLKMDDIRYGRCRDNLKGQKEMATEISKKNAKKVSRHLFTIQFKGKA
jgi:hypothetical protein